MSQLLVVARPHLAHGFQLAGVQAFPASDPETAQERIEQWLDEQLSGLCAIDDGLMEQLPAGLVQRLERSEQLQTISIPGGRPLAQETERQQRIAGLLRRAVGFQIEFGAEPEAEPQE